MKTITRFIPVLLLLTLSCTEKEEKREYEAPEWAKEVVWYQIFPERFRNGNPDNDPVKSLYNVPESWSISPWTGDWYDQQGWEVEMGEDFYRSVFSRRYGGDLDGVIEKLDYLKNLGIGAIYFNPVFDARSMHKYDAAYYHHVDRFFGDDPEADVAMMEEESPNDPSTWQWTSADKKLLKLIEEAHKRDIKIVLDGVWNHTGPEFWAFRDIVENQEQSEFSGWYDIISYDDPSTPENEFDYHGWWGFKGLPELKEENGGLVDPVRDHIFAVTTRWMDPNGDGDPSDGIDGWRLDVAEEVGKRFWKEWHEHVRELNPEAITVAEIWTDKATEFINSDMFYSVMNYRVAMANMDFFIDREIKATAFRDRLTEIYESYPEEANFVFQNLMDSHDTARLPSMIVNPGREYDRDGKPREGFDVRKPNEAERRVQKLIALFQYTYVGAPMIYYGTESGMWGADDPDDRKPMVWEDMDYAVEDTHPYGEKRPADENNFDPELFDYYKKLGQIRNESESLQKGELNYLQADDEKNTLVFTRISKFDNCLVIINNSDSEQVVKLNEEEFFEVNDYLVDLITGISYSSDKGVYSFPVAPYSGLILK
jgi:glycosidase